jgi:hypothetical protein
MKKIIVFLLLLPTLLFSQTITLNEETSLYSFEKINEHNSTVDDLKNNFLTNFEKLSYSNILVTDDFISGENFYSVMIMSTPMQVKYVVRIDFKTDKYKLLINKFTLEDKRWSPVPIENLKSGKKKWIQNINDKLPSIIKSIESINKDW